MLTRITATSCPLDPASYAYCHLHLEAIVDRDISAQLTCHILQKLPLVTCSRSFTKLNVGRQIFCRVSLDSVDCLFGCSFIDAYLQHPLTLDLFCLLDLAQQWSYNQGRKTKKWKKRIVPAIVHVWLRFTSILAKDSNAFLEFCWSELLLYKPFCSFTKNIDVTKHDILSNWECIRNTYCA